MYKIAIVDDEMNGEVGRKSCYEKLLKNRFEVVQYVSTPAEIQNMAKIEVHAYIIDMVYEGDEYSGITFETIINSINLIKNVPIIIVSDKWGSFRTPLVVQTLCKYNNIVMCFGWDQINEPGNNNNFILNQIESEINKFYRYTNILKDSNEDVKILHLSDLQFGDKNKDTSSIFAAGSIKTYLSDINKTPDIIVITGDIASHGLWTEYEEAYKWLEELCEDIWGKKTNWGERVVIIPGNHDVDYMLCLPDVYRWDLTNKNFSTEKSIDRKESITDLYRKKAMIDYARFMRKVTGDISYLDEYDDLYRVDERYLNWGIRFYELNTAQHITPYEPRKINVDADNFGKLNKNTLKFNSKNVFNIIVSHFGPEDIGYRQSDADKARKWDIMRSFIESTKINMYMSGHVHKSEIRRLEDNGSGSNFSRNVIVSTASTCTLDVGARPAEEYRGFNILELRRENGVVKEVYGYQYWFEGATIRAPKREDIFKSGKIKYSY